MVATDGPGHGRPALLWTLLAALVVTACGGTSSALAARSGQMAAPSKEAKMICAAEAQNELAGALGVPPTHPAEATWVSPLYSCRYTYVEGVIVVSVRELADVRTATASFDALAVELGKRGVIAGLGQGAFDTNDDTVIVRKDAKVLRVEVSGLPARFGNPALKRSEVSTRIALVIMGCWKGD